MTWRDLIQGYQWKFRFTMALLFIEYGLAILFPLFIGIAIDDAIEGSTTGAIQLGVLGLAELIIGMGRRVFDSRLYAKIFRRVGEKVLNQAKDSTTSVKTARLNMIRELVEFMETSLPELVGNIIGLVGVIIIIGTLNTVVFIGGLICTVVIAGIYLLTSRRTLRLNRHYNDELEKQVDVVDSKDPEQLHQHLKAVMKWNIKLSDLEAGNFSFSWLILIVFLLISIIQPIQEGVVQYGALFALVMYAFEYLEYVINLPLFYQHWLRLTEIRERLSEW